MKETQKGFKVDLTSNIPNYKSEEIQNYSTSNFLQKIQRISQISSVSLPDAKLCLAHNYSLYLQGHTQAVNCISITTDSNYIISGSSDTTVRIWNFHSRTQESILEGHTHAVTSVPITTDIST